MPPFVTFAAQEDQVRVHIPALLRPGKNVVELRRVQGQLCSAVLARTTPLLEETKTLLPLPLPLRPEKKRRER